MMMISNILLAALMVQSAPAPASVPTFADSPAYNYDFTATQKYQMRCGALFAIVAGGQKKGDEVALAYPEMEPDSKEYFVETFVQIVEDTGLTPEQMTKEVYGLVGWYKQREENSSDREADLASDMQKCLPLLKADRFRTASGN